MKFEFEFLRDINFSLISNMAITDITKYLSSLTFKRYFMIFA